MSYNLSQFSENIIKNTTHQYHRPAHRNVTPEQYNGPAVKTCIPGQEPFNFKIPQKEGGNTEKRPGPLQNSLFSKNIKRHMLYHNLASFSVVLLFSTMVIMWGIVMSLM